MASGCCLKPHQPGIGEAGVGGVATGSCRLIEQWDAGDLVTAVVRGHDGYSSMQLGIRKGYNPIITSIQCIPVDFLAEI